MKKLKCRYIKDNVKNMVDRLELDEKAYYKMIEDYYKSFDNKVESGACYVSVRKK